MAPSDPAAARAARPHEPSLLDPAGPSTGGHIGTAPEDFCVDEVPLYPFSGAGEHLYVRVEKRGLTTRQALDAIARAAGVPARDVGSAGLKDRHAVTTQWLSLPARTAGDPAGWSLPEGLRVVESTLHGNKLRTGHLAGNRFRIRLVGVSADAPEVARALLERLSAEGLPNAFGPQRFGRGGDNLARGLAFLRGTSGRRPPPFEQKLLASALQSDVFNRYLDLRRALGLSAPIEGEVLRLAGAGATFVVEDPEREAPRLASRDVLLTGPMVGPRGGRARGRALDLEQAAVAAAGLEPADLAALARHAEGTRRDLLVFPADLALESATPGELVLSFSLPAGSYATELVRQLTHAPPGEDRAAGREGDVSPA